VIEVVLKSHAFVHSRDARGVSAYTQLVSTLVEPAAARQLTDGDGGGERGDTGASPAQQHGNGDRGHERPAGAGSPQRPHRPEEVKPERRGRTAEPKAAAGRPPIPGPPPNSGGPS
jgi:hypothetical protein